MLDEIDRIASETPSSTAIKDGSGLVYSYKEMIFKSRSIARAILKLNIAPKSRIAVLQEPTADWICSMFGIWQAGATYVPLETSQGAPHLATILRDAKPEAVIAHVDTLTLLEEIGWDRPNAAINTSNLLVTPAIPLDSPGLSPNDEAIILYTSGSTGIPKVCIVHAILKIRPIDSSICTGNLATAPCDIQCHQRLPAQLASRGTNCAATDRSQFRSIVVASASRPGYERFCSSCHA